MLWLSTSSLAYCHFISTDPNVEPAERKCFSMCSEEQDLISPSGFFNSRTVLRTTPSHLPSYRSVFVGQEKEGKSYRFQTIQVTRGQTEARDEVISLATRKPVNIINTVAPGWSFRSGGWVLSASSTPWAGFLGCPRPSTPHQGCREAA